MQAPCTAFDLLMLSSNCIVLLNNTTNAMRAVAIKILVYGINSIPGKYRYVFRPN